MSIPPPGGDSGLESDQPQAIRAGEGNEPRPMLPRLLAVGAAVAFIALLAYGLVIAAPDDRIDQSLADGRAPAAPPFELPLLQEGDLPAPLADRIARVLVDGRLDLGELRGTPVVLNFWASWCVPCQEEAPLLERSWGRFGPAGVLFVGLNMQDLTDDARGFISEFQNSYLNVRDQTDEVANDWGVAGLPETFFITADGDVVSHVIGVLSREQVDAGVAAARSGAPQAALRGGPQRPVR